jgi:catechol 2,3-dioxygenase-like lactoylglutathione lyase family enzyme
MSRALSPATLAGPLAAALMLLAGAAVSLPLAAAPVPEADRIDIDLRRTTLIVADMEASLAFYRDALGLSIAYDQVIRTPRDAASDEAAERSLRLVLLQANDDYIGMIGLIEYLKPRKAPRVEPIEPFSIGSTVLLFNTTALDLRFASAAATPRVRVLNEPAETTYPGYNGGPPIPVRVSILTDPDGYVVELNQLLTDRVR